VISLDSIVWRDIDRRIQKEAEERAAQLANGSAQSFDDYRFRVGYLQALADVRIWSSEVNKKHSGRDERN
jgi:hypothetical protein